MTPQESDPTFRLMYRSRNLIAEDERKDKLGFLFSTARSNNKQRGITGALLLSGDCFVQVLEGEEEVVRKVSDRIRRDARHGKVELLEAAEVDERVFARWSMARVSTDGEPDIALIAHTDGISPAAGQRSTPGREQVLEVMREAVRQAFV